MVFISENLLCSTCKKNIALPYHAYCKKCYGEWMQVYLGTYQGQYIYQIVNKKTRVPLYIGSTENIYNRWQKHFNSTKDTNFAKWCYWNKVSKENYEMLVLDLSEYDIIDTENRLILEHELIYLYRDSLINQQMREPLNSYEIDELEKIYKEVDIHHLNWDKYEKIIQHKKNTYQDGNLDKYPKK